MDGDVVACAAARRRVASSKMKRMKQAGCKDQEELDDDNEELFAELGIMRFFFTYLQFPIHVRFSVTSAGAVIGSPVSLSLFVKGVLLLSLSSCVGKL